MSFILFVAFQVFLGLEVVLADNPNMGQLAPMSGGQAGNFMGKGFDMAKNSQMVPPQARLAMTAGEALYDGANTYRETGDMGLAGKKSFDSASRGGQNMMNSMPGAGFATGAYKDYQNGGNMQSMMSHGRDEAMHDATSGNSIQGMGLKAARGLYEGKSAQDIGKGAFQNYASGNPALKGAQNMLSSGNNMEHGYQSGMGGGGGGQGMNQMNNNMMGSGWNQMDNGMGMNGNMNGNMNGPMTGNYPQQKPQNGYGTSPRKQGLIKRLSSTVKGYMPGGKNKGANQMNQNMNGSPKKTGGFLQRTASKALPNMLRRRTTM